jgi:hypothetical protein
MLVEWWRRTGTSAASAQWRRGAAAASSAKCGDRSRGRELEGRR